MPRSCQGIGFVFQSFRHCADSDPFLHSGTCQGQQKEAATNEKRNDEADPAITTVSSSSIHPFPWPQVAQHPSFGICSAIVSALMGVGGLPLTMSYITEATHLPHHCVQGKAICALTPSILVSVVLVFIPSLCRQLRRWPWGPWWGAQVALGLTEEQLRAIYLTSLVAFGGRSTFGAARNIRNILQVKTRTITLLASHKNMQHDVILIVSNISRHVFIFFLQVVDIS